MLNFGSVITRSSHRSVLTRLCWDHFIPYSYLCCSPGDNWVAACQICNGYKTNHMYESVDEAREDIMHRWILDARSVAWEPQISSECDGPKWATSFAAWLSVGSTDLEMSEEMPVDNQIMQVRWTVADIMAELGFSSVDVTRSWLRKQAVPVLTTESIGKAGQYRNLYDKDVVLAARADQQRRVPCRNRAGTWERIKEED